MSEEKIHKVIDEILNEDLGPEISCDKSKESCILEKGSCVCNNAVEICTTFSIKVMEAMRSLQRKKNGGIVFSVAEIVEFIKNNYRNDGDVYSQVLTTLTQLLCQGFVKKSRNKYHLIGPFAHIKKGTVGKRRRKCKKTKTTKTPKQEKPDNCVRKSFDNTELKNSKNEDTKKCSTKETQEGSQTNPNFKCSSKRKESEESFHSDSTNCTCKKTHKKLCKNENSNRDNYSTSSSDDSIYKAISSKCRFPQKYEKDLKNWIRNCRLQGQTNSE